MGVDGLLRFVQSASSAVHVSHFQGATLAVDASCWLHRGAHACAVDLALGQLTDRFVSFSLKMVRCCRQFGVELVFVFDGAVLIPALDLQTLTLYLPAPTHSAPTRRSYP